MRSRVGRKWIAAFALSMAALGGGPANAKDVTEIVLGLPANLRVSFAYLTAATELGYFEQEGLKVRLQELAGGAVVMPQVGTKAILIGAGTGDPLIVANQPGKSRLPVKFFYNQTREYIWEFVVPPDSPVKSLADLKGKTIGVGALTNSHMPISRMILKEAGLEVTKDYSFISVGDGAPAFKALTDGQIAAYNTSTTNIASFESVGMKLRRLQVGDRFQNLFQTGYFAHEDSIREKPEQLIGFGRAVTKATIFCQTATAWCIKNFWKHYPNLKPREGTEDENAAKLVESVRGAWKALFAFPKGQPRRFAEYPAGAWQNVLDILHEGGEIATNKVDTASFYTNDLVAGINAFDEAAVVKQAEGYK